MECELIRNDKIGCDKSGKLVKAEIYEQGLWFVYGALSYKDQKIWWLRKMHLLMDTYYILTIINSWWLRKVKLGST